QIHSADCGECARRTEMGRAGPRKLWEFLFMGRCWARRKQSHRLERKNRKRRWRAGLPPYRWCEKCWHSVARKRMQCGKQNGAIQSARPKLVQVRHTGIQGARVQCCGSAEIPR